MEEIYVRSTEKMLEGEMDRNDEPCSSGYEKYAAEALNTGNSRNGKASKNLKRKFGEVEIKTLDLQQNQNNKLRS